MVVTRVVDALAVEEVVAAAASLAMDESAAKAGEAA
jgi:hypothetical protein